MSSAVNAHVAASQQTREALLEAGLSLLLKLPASAAFGHLTASRIATEAGRTTGAFFHQWPTQEAFLQDFVAYVLRPDLAVSGETVAEEIMQRLDDGASFQAAVVDATRTIPQQTANDPQTIIELLLWNRARHDEEFRQSIAAHYEHLGQTAAPMYEALATLLDRELRPPFTAEVVAALYAAVAEGLALRSSITPGFFPDELFGWIAVALIPLVTREPEDDRDASRFVVELPLRPSSDGPD
jgi:AcrR family transcriptional regulator